MFRCLFELILAFGLMLLIFRPFDRRTVLERMPLFLGSAFGLLMLGVADLPTAFPQYFAATLDNSAGRVSQGSWFLEHWISPLLTVWAVIILIAMILSIANLLRGASPIPNILAILSCGFWIVLASLAATDYFVWYL